jgi:hypothetical protein
MTKSATVAPMHNMTAAANAAEEKAGEDARNFQNTPSIAIPMHVNATNMNLCNWSAYALSLNVVSRTKIANKQSQDAAPRYRDPGLCHRIKKPAENPSEATPSIRRLRNFCLNGGTIGLFVLSVEVVVWSSPLDFRHRISALTAKNITQPELRTKAYNDV